MSWNPCHRGRKARNIAKAARRITALLSVCSALQAHAEDASTFKIQDLDVLLVPSFGVSYHDNISISQNGSRDDFILSPLLTARGTYPFTDRNVLSFNVGVGYNQYIKNDDYSGLRLTSGSGTEFVVGIGDFEFNLHENISYSKDAATQTSIAGNGRYGIINNTAGITTTWDLGDIISSIGYDHQNTLSPAGTAQEYRSQDRASEVLSGRTGFRLRPNFTTGIQASGTFTKYDKRVLNNNTSYSAGPYAELQLGDLAISPSAGYSAYQFDHSSASIRTASSDSWYADLTLSYPVTTAITTSLSLGRETQLGIQSDVVETYYVSSRIGWGIVEGGNLNVGLSYVNGKQGVGNEFGNLTENYDSISPSIGFSYQITKRLLASLDYRLTLRTSDGNARDYTQNMVSLVLSYPLY